MKSIYNILLTVLLLILMSVFVIPQKNSVPPQEENQIHNAVEELFKLSKQKNYEKAAALIVYNGEDSNRKLKAVLNPQNEDELNAAKRICKKIAALLNVSEKYSIKEIVNEKNQERKITKVEVTFLNAGQELLITLKFVKLPSGYALLEIN
ncbi:hypothetical protein ACSSWA_07720 [Melioribacter sp. Ez-97]|jgi:hypothetical protein|uniref:hypothetical protein n=1 Tax=Melioribacter sp. Ez-97 TaxID=3423434 RepID=UPI003ED96D59